MLAQISLDQALKRLGNATVFIGDPLTSGGLKLLGAKEGAAQLQIEQSYSDLTAPELTGDVVHKRYLLSEKVTITVPTIMGEPELYAKLSPTGTAGGGFSRPQEVLTTSVVLVPEIDMGDDGLSYNGGGSFGWLPAPPAHTIWLWKASITRGGLSYSHENGGKVICEITFEGLFDPSKPEGHKVYTIGDPTEVGIDVSI